jgi:hypothetical protein
MKLPSVKDKLSTLKSFRRARGLCIRCGEKWAPGHRCSPQPQFHALQEVWELLQDNFESTSDEPVLNEGLADQDAEAPANLFLTLSVAAVTGDDVVHTMQFYGILSGRSVLILVDSGDSLSFIHEAVVVSILGRRPLPLPKNCWPRIVLLGLLPQEEWLRDK